MEKATKHTAIISDPVSMWSKLAWDADVFREIQISYPDEMQPLAYAAINVCIAAASLQDWVEVFLKRETTKAKKTWNEEAFFQGVINAIPEQSSCVAIANTSKHSEFRERRWTNGEVQLTWEDGDEDVPPGYVLCHVISGSHSEGLAVNRFDALCNNWWKYLTDHGLTNGQTNTPKWYQNKLHRIFGTRPIADE